MGGSKGNSRGQRKIELTSVAISKEMRVLGRDIEVVG
jgi:hypothetical protein